MAIVESSIVPFVLTCQLRARVYQNRNGDLKIFIFRDQEFKDTATETTTIFAAVNLEKGKTKKLLEIIGEKDAILEGARCNVTSNSTDWMRQIWTCNNETLRAAMEADEFDTENEEIVATLKNGELQLFKKRFSEKTTREFF